ncbi:MAG: hypothetical protein ACRCY4_06020 [Brevinema sp.]
MKRLLLLLFLFPLPLSAQFRFGGYFEDTASFTTDVDFINSIQLKTDLEYRAETWRIFGDIRLNLFYGYTDIVSLSPNNFLFTTQNGKNNFAIGLEVPRLYFRGFSKAGNFIVGRSYLNFGQPQIFNPLEWNKTFSLFDPTATRPGINMFAWDLGLGSYGRIKAFVGGDDNWLTPLGGVEIIFGAPRLEMGLAYQYKDKDYSVFGLNLKADIVLTFSLTYAAHVREIISGKGLEDYHEVSVGVDYSFPIHTSSLLIKQIFYYNSSGATSEAERLMPLQQNIGYFSSSAYSYTELTVTINEFISFGANVLVNMIDGSGVVLPNGTFTLANNLVLDMILGIAFGARNTELGPSSEQIPNVNIQARLRASF